MEAISYLPTPSSSVAGSNTPVPVSPSNPLPVVTSASGGGPSNPAVPGLSYTSTNKSGTTTTNVTTAIASNANRKGWSLSNISSVLWLVRDDGGTPSATVGTPLYPGQTVSDGGKNSTAAINFYQATGSGINYSGQEYT